MLKKYFLPDYFFNNIYEIKPDFLSSMGIRAVISDIDNTLVTYDDPEPTDSVLEWIASLGAAGIALSFVSNNNAARVKKFNLKLGFYASHNSGKPSVRAYKKAAEAMGAAIHECAVVGDQIFTDIIAAKRLNMTACIVKPVKDKLTPLFFLKRSLERFIYKIYKIKY